ncbi:hypothetical protein AB1K89_13235 [Sporosarcina sp. 179-K 8C2 HS]
MGWFFDYEEAGRGNRGTDDVQVASSIAVKLPLNESGAKITTMGSTSKLID